MRTNTQIKINMGNSYKLGLDEVVGLEAAMREVAKPILDALREHMYWNRDVNWDKAEYKSRDGFIPYKSNCGGLEIIEVIPECERCDFDYLEFGEWDGEHHCDGTDTDNCECAYAVDGEYDAKLRIWFKFEGFDEDTGSLNFYLYLGGGNGDAPYFRTKYESTVFEREFSCKSVAGLKRAASKHVADLAKIIQDGEVKS